MDSYRDRYAAQEAGQQAEALRSGLALLPVIRAPKDDRSSCGPRSQGRLHSPAPLNLRLDGIIDSEVLDQKGSWAEQIRQRAYTAPSTIRLILVSAVLRCTLDTVRRCHRTCSR
jgi:hypothetical protein